MSLSQDTFAKGIKIMNSVCVKQVDTDDTMNIYYITLKHLDNDIYLESILNLIKTKENIYNPFSPAEIINKARDLSNQDKLLNDLIDKIKIDIIKYGYNNKPNYSPEIENALSSIGGWHKLCLSEKKEFEMLTNEMKNHMPEFIKKEVIYLDNSKIKIENKPK